MTGDSSRNAKISWGPALTLQLLPHRCSWQKEFEAYHSRKAKICNAVAVIMHEHSVLPEEARAMLKTMAVAAEQLFVELRDQWLALKVSKSLAVVKYVEAVGWLAAGISMWSSSCPRYNSHRQLALL